MITAEDINKANEPLKSIELKGKGYVVVAQRVKGFRQIVPNGAITTEIVEDKGDEITMRAIVTDGDGKILATGTAHEVKGEGMVNKTSWLENCETSAVGRALAFLGIGIDGEIASAEEVVNAQAEQTKAQLGLINAKEKKVLENMCKDRGLDIEKTFPMGLDLTGAQYTKAVEMLAKVEVKK